MQYLFLIFEFAFILDKCVLYLQLQGGKHMQTGYNKLNITPKKAVRIAGYNRKELSKGVLDPIEINSLVIKEDKQTIIISILDSIIIEDSVILPVKQAIFDKYGIPFEQIVIGCIHTHSAPAYFKPFFENVYIDPELQRNLIKSFIESISLSMNSLEDSFLTMEKTEIEGLYGNRNNKNGIADKSVHVIHFMNSHSKKDICSFIQMSCHPTILNGSNLKLSADLLGWVRQKYQQKTNVPCMIVNGYCGDVSTRFYRELKGEDELERVSSSIINQMNHLHTLDTNTEGLKFTTFEKKYSYNGQTDLFVQSEIPHLKKIIAQSDDTSQLAMSKMLLHNLDFKASKGEMTLNLYSHIIKLGNILLISLPGDITTVLGQRIVNTFKDYHVIIMGYCENYSNYFVCKEDYGKYFETYISRLSKGNADDFIQTVIDQTRVLLK